MRRIAALVLAGWLLGACASRDAQLVEELEGHDLVVTRTERGLVIFIPDVLFAFDSAELTDDARRRVAAAGGTIERLSGGRDISVEGHADSLGSAEYNVRLSLRRAETVRGELEVGGLDPGRLRVVGHGESLPVASNDSEEGRRQNRRVEIVIED
jgi:outer membrane protein OmpA-like peptidoglycan-associated protein